MRCNEVMSRVPTFLNMEQSVYEAAQMMRDENVGFLPICDASSKAIGALTDRDVVVRIVADQRSSDTAVRDIMSPDVITCRENDELDLAEKLMEKHQVSRIMCVDADGVLTGIVAMGDVARQDGKHLQGVVREVKSDHASAPN